MNIQKYKIISFIYCNIILCFANLTQKRIFDDDYYLNYDYELSNNSITSELKSPESLLLPNPENIDSKYTIDVLPNVELPDDSLSDTDLKDHDFIDNLMYVYYGSHNKINGNYGPQIIIIGSILSCALQFFIIICVSIKKNIAGKKTMRSIFLHMIGSFCFSNLVLMFAVYPLKNYFKCLMVALILHYSYLLTAFWMFLYCFHIYTRLASRKNLQNKYFFLLSYGGTFVFCMISYIFLPSSFETKRFCFMSVQKGMIINYMLPVSTLIVLTTIYSLNGIRKINIELSKLEFSSSIESLNGLKENITNEKKQNQEYCDEEIMSLKESKICLKLICAIQTAFDIIWFIVVLALENNSNNIGMAVIYTISSCLLNIYIFAKSKALLPNLSLIGNSTNNVISAQEQKLNKNQDSVATRDSSDNIPLLINVDNCTEMRELRLDYISTISN